jgi:uncharacterized protein (TIGR03663 family)
MQGRAENGLGTTSWLDRPLLAALNLNWEKVLYGLFIGLAIISRFWSLGLRVMSHDETVHVQWSWYLYQGRGYAHTPLSHGPFLFHATALSYYLFGDNDFSARFVVALFGVVLVALPYGMRRWLGRSGALVASFLFLISPSLLYYSRYIRHDIPVIVWSLIAITAVFRYLSGDSLSNDRFEQQRSFLTGSTRWLVTLAAAISLMFATKEVAFIYIAIVGLFLVLLLLSRMGPPHWLTRTWAQAGRTLLWMAVISLLVAVLSQTLADVFASPPQDETAQAEETEVPDLEESSPASDLFDTVAHLAALTMAGAVAGYVGLLALGSPSHQRLVLTAAGLATVLLVGCTLFLFSLNLVQLFPIRYRDCGQAPVPDQLTGELSCSGGDCQLIQGRCQRPIPIVAGDNVAEFDETGARIAIGLSRLDMLITVILILIAALLAAGGTYWVLRQWMPVAQVDPRPLDLILFIGSFTLPFLSALAINGLSRIVSRFFFGIDAAFNALDYSEAGLLRSSGFVFVFLAISVVVGMWWDWRRWLASATVFILIFVVLFTTFFTNGNGLASGTVGSLGYWLEQQDVQRGSQPWYYYGLLVPLYEYLPLFGLFAAAAYLMVKGLRPRLAAAPATHGGPAHEEPVPEFGSANPREPTALVTDGNLHLEVAFVLFLILWNLMTWVAYSSAGEKMPWLTTHFAVPLALVTGWVVGRLIDSLDWRSALRRGGWVLIPIAPVIFAALVQFLSPWVAASPGSRPFSGYGLGQLNATMGFVSALLVLVIALSVLNWVRRRIGWPSTGRLLAISGLGILVVLTIRTSWLFNYVNFDYATEFLVYAHSTPDVREVMDQIEDISRRTSGDLSLDIGYTADGSYPFIWYLRNYPNASQLPKPPSRPDLEKPVIVAGDAEWTDIEPYVGDRFTCHEYNFLWWPMQDYYGLNWERIGYALTNSEMRAAVWDIIFRRDYRKYEEATGKTVRPSQWPLRDGFRFCVQRDVMASLWSENAGPADMIGEVIEPSPELPDFAGLESVPAADQVIDELGPFGNFNAPHDLAIDSTGNLYVADSNNHRIVKLSPDGEVLDTWDSNWWVGLQTWKPGCLDTNDQPLALGDGQFCEPWGITVGPDGRVYVADTWNHRVQIFDRDGQFLTKFGVWGQSGSSVTSAPGEFYGPRDVVVDDQGNIYVSDTGNKRIQVYDSGYQFVRAFGGPGIVEGRLEEPVGLSIGPNQELYVADTWNNRIQVFDLVGAYLRQWPVLGWESESVANKPYVASDRAGHIYVSDPEGRRILVFDDQGTPLAVLSAVFQLPTGVVLDANDALWVSDAANQRLLRFPPLALNQDVP